PGQQTFVLEIPDGLADGLLADAEPTRELRAARALEIDEGQQGVPLLKGCCARFVCRNVQRHEGGDHIVFISEVVGFEREERAPLVYYAGAYRRLLP
ncbi:MAG TPA: flavin reductase family protein, partial [Thauera sp.]|nr:flavin reductase family protein [Thauera sp.]